MIKVLLIILIPLNALSIQNHSSLYADTTVNSVFNREEISYLMRIVAVFDDFILANVGSNKSIHKAYNHYFNAVTNEELFFDLRENLKVSNSDSVQSMISRLKGNGMFNEIWKDTDYYYYHLDRKQGVKLEGLQINLKGKYLQMLKSLAKENDYYKRYYNGIMGSGAISPTGIAQFLNGFNKMDFECEVNRLVFAIHYITVASGIE